MGAKYYLGLDQGTTGVTAILFDQEWHVVSRGYEKISLLYPKTGWVEHNPKEVWNSVLAATAQALGNIGVSASSLLCIGLNHEGETVLAWNRATGEPIYNAIVWQDRRTSRRADLMADEYNDLVHNKTGLLIDSYFTAPKLQWIMENVPEAKTLAGQGNLLIGTIDTWMVWKMTHGQIHVTDASTASRTLLFNIHTGDWDEDLLQLFDIPINALPEIKDSACIYGHTDPLDFLGANIPISGILVDQQAALAGQACVTPGTIKTTYGTGCFMLMNSGETAVCAGSGLLPTVAWQLKGKRTYALDGGVYITGGAVKWLHDNLNIISSFQETESMAMSVPDNGGVFFVPAFTGLAAPHWDSYASGMLIGLTGATEKAHIVRATLEATAYQVRDVLDIMSKDAKVPITVMRCNGGPTTNRFLMQFQADILGIPLDIPQVADTTALGAAFMGAVGIGEYSSIDDISNIWKLHHRYEPKMSADQRDTLLYNWHRAVERAKYWRED
ncbi:glycerol kinase [Anaerotignum neopropionicum]|uniref:glycerol kinase n=1 Tax=Anaerotignum neopropionicum TaxID=36847 RepID=A0A136WEL7_9FIRM|nr:glycerol kinase GlpK [Anaerotignum neopropionicum]KXL52955.1 glycerol kinase [Anaerotignum neopropionicum]